MRQISYNYCDMERLLKKYECVKIFDFDGDGDGDFFINAIGYNDFRTVKPQRFLRMQRQHTLHFIVSGKGRLTVNGATRELKKHDFFYLDNARPFIYVPDEADPWEYVWFDFVGENAYKNISAAGFTAENNVKTSGNGNKLTAEFKNFYEKVLNGESISYFNALYLFFLALDSVAVPPTAGKLLGGKSFINEVKTHIELKCLNPDFSVEKLCSDLNISHSHLCRVFKQSEGVPVISYIKDFKLSRAKALLTATDLSLAEIADTCGFEEYEYFLKSFKKAYGLSPTEYRKQK